MDKEKQLELIYEKMRSILQNEWFESLREEHWQVFRHLVSRGEMRTLFRFAFKGNFTKQEIRNGFWNKITIDDDEVFFE